MFRRFGSVRLCSVLFGCVLESHGGYVEFRFVTICCVEVGRLRLGALSGVEFGYVLAVELS